MEPPAAAAAASPAAPPPPPPVDNDEWDAEGFEIPSLKTTPVKTVETLKPTLHKSINTQVENLYLGPHGAKPGLRSQQQPAQDSPTGGGGKRQQRFKQKLKDADHRSSNGSFGRDNKVEVICDLVGAKPSQIRPVTTPTPTRKNSAADWLDPHCQESQFDRPRTRG